MYSGSLSRLLQSLIEHLKCVNLPDEEIPIASGNLGVCDVDHVLWEKQSEKRSEVEPLMDLQIIKMLSAR